MTVEVGMKASSKKKLARSTWEMKKLANSSDAQKVEDKWREMRKTEIAMGDCIKSDLGRVGEEWKK